MQTERSYLPAAGRDAFLPFYDSFTRLIGADKQRLALIAQADVRPGQRVLDLGCGTGTLAIELARRSPGVTIVGVDPDPKALSRAGKKAKRAGVELKLERGFADRLPFPDGSFDRVLSSFVLHHLDDADKQKALSEVARVLAPGGRLELVDFRGRNDVTHAGRLHRWLHSSERLAENSESSVLDMMRQAGLSDARVVDRANLLLGGIVFYQGRR